MLDAETSELADGETPKTKFWGLATHARYYRFGSTPKLRRFLYSFPRSLQLLHHSNFDILQLLQDRQNVKIQRSHKSKIIACRYGKHTTLNTFAVFPVPLKTILNAYGRKKLSLKNLNARNKSDCVDGLFCVEALAERFEKLCGVNPLDVGTIAGTGLKACEKVAGKMPVEHRFESAYRGGRVEAFRLGSYLTIDQQLRDISKQAQEMKDGADRTILFPHVAEFQDVSRFDINSSYPFSILDCPRKAKLIHAWVCVKDYWCPFFVEEISEKLVFANGTFSTWFWEDTFEKYIRPRVERCRFKIISQHTVDLSWLCELKPLIQRVYDEKRIAVARHNRATAECCKLFLNSIYGRFGLRGSHEMAIVSDRVASGDSVVYHRLRNHRFLSFKEISRNVRHNFAFAAYITDNARARLYAGFHETSAFYGDTDSVFTRQSVTKRKASPCGISLDVGKSCGQWKLEKNGTLELFGLKDYRFAKRVTLKGGKKSFTWTLKQFASEGTVKLNSRRRGEPHHKRVVLSDGTTRPHIVRV